MESKDSGNANACVAIPAYKNSVDARERLVLQQARRIFQNAPVVFFHPVKLDIRATKDAFGSDACSFRAFDNHHFDDIDSYNRLLLNEHFYERFSDFDYMLLYQFDAFVFSDQLEEWCNKGIDYIGAPWFKDFDSSGVEMEFLPWAGNGGFSLRHLTKIRKILKHRINIFKAVKLLYVLRRAHIEPHDPAAFTTAILKAALRKQITFGELCQFVYRNAAAQNEDYFFALIIPKLFPDFKAATAMEAIPFAFECQPERLLEMNGGKLPFGCHAWHRNSPQFWQRFIKEDTCITPRSGS